jgi:molecular chaperone DnaJ
MRDHYATLGLNPGADDAAIRAAYRRLVREHHPDASGQPVDSARFAQITEAYRTLTDPLRRRRYDALRLLAAATPVRRLFDLFEDSGSRSRLAQLLARNVRRIFAAAERGERWRGRDILIQKQIDFAEAYAGADVTVAYDRLERCAACQGSGRRTFEPCGLCGGRGEIVFPGPARMKKACPKCGGAGVVGHGRCASCHGQGRLRQAHAVTLRAPGGTDTGARLRAAGQGDAGLGAGRDGDLIVEIAVAGSLHYARDGQNLVIEKSVPLCTAMQGGAAAVGLPDGVAVEIEIPPDSYPDRVLRVAGRGFESSASRERGDVVVVLDVYLPDELDAASRRIAMEWFYAVKAGETEKAADLAFRLMEAGKGVISRDDGGQAGS